MKRQQQNGMTGWPTELTQLIGRAAITTGRNSSGRPKPSTVVGEKHGGLKQARQNTTNFTTTS